MLTQRCEGIEPLHWGFHPRDSMICAARCCSDSTHNMIPRIICRLHISKEYVARNILRQCRFASLVSPLALIKTIDPEDWTFHLCIPSIMVDEDVARYSFLWPPSRTMTFTPNSASNSSSGR